MALWFNLRINDERIGQVEIRRREHLDLTDQAAIADAWSTYDVYRDDRLIGQVRHVYGHGAWKLLALAADLIAGERARMHDRTFHDRGEQLRRRYGIDGTAGDAQDVEHPYHRDEATGACLVCGLAERYRKHREDA